LQIVGKFRLANTPWENHSWAATFYVVPRGLTTGPIALASMSLSLTFDVFNERLVVETSTGDVADFALEAMSVARFAEQVRVSVEKVGAVFAIDGMPNEIPDAIAFADDVATRPYDSAAVRRFHAALVNVDRVFRRFRTGFLGKVSPVHLFWGSFDLAVTRFSGRTAPRHPGGVPGLPDAVTREAYSHEVSSAGFWAGEGVGEPMFYSYAYPAPPRFADQVVEPAQARWDARLGEFLLPYGAVQSSDDPDATLMRFLESTYRAAADLGGWDCATLDCRMGQPGVPRLVR
jgi:hypothetical protein